MIATSIEQSKKLLELGIDPNTADIFYADGERLAVWNNKEVNLDNEDIPCWSLAALLNILPSIQELCSSTDHYYRIMCMNLVSEWHDNAVDACVEMIDKLHKKELL